MIDEGLKKRSGYLPAMLLKGELLVGKRNWSDAIAALDPLVSGVSADASTLELAARAHLAPRPDLVASADLDASQRRARELRPPRPE